MNFENRMMGVPVGVGVSVSVTSTHHSVLKERRSSQFLPTNIRQEFHPNQSQSDNFISPDPLKRIKKIGLHLSKIGDLS